jgi:hypothetical protein
MTDDVVVNMEEEQRHEQLHRRAGGSACLSAVEAQGFLDDVGVVTLTYT